MSLSEKLKRLASAGHGSVATIIEAPRVIELPAAPNPESCARALQIERVRRALQSISARHAREAPAVPSGRTSGALPGELSQTAWGPLQAATRTYAAGYRHGRLLAAEALRATGDHLAALSLDLRLAGCSASSLLFLDTETTGLAGGTGTLPFLIGLSWFEGDAVVVEQLVLPRPGMERAMLGHLGERIAAASAIVTFNGKSFDWPLLRTRFVMNRLPVPALPRHLDLLHCARRVFRRRMSSVRLVQVEREVLGHHRVDNLDGSLIPETYFAYLRSGDGGSLTPVLEHNAQDLVALPTVLGALVRGFSGEVDDPRDALGLAEVAFRGRRFDQSESLAVSAVSLARTSRLQGEALRFLGRVHRKKGNARGCADALVSALAAGGVCDAEVHLELSKLFEHRFKDFPRALGHAERARTAEPATGNDRRLTRLRGKVAARGSGLFDLPRA